MKKGGVCIYYKDFLPLIKEDDIIEKTVDNEKCFSRAFIDHQAKIAINLVISVKILVCFLRI